MGEKILKNLFKFDRDISQNVLNFVLEIWKRAIFIALKFLLFDSLNLKSLAGIYPQGYKFKLLDQLWRTQRPLLHLRSV